MAVPPLDHGIIGNGRLLALVSPTSAIDWLCMPRFDSPSIFGRLLDADRGGTFRVLSRGREITGAAAYAPNSNVLTIRFEDGDDAWEVIDFAPRIPRGASVEAPVELIRLVRPLRGLPKLSFDFAPRPDYARAPSGLVSADGGLTVAGVAGPLQIFSNVARDYLATGAEVPLRRPLHFVLRYGQRAQAPTEAEVRHLLDDTVAGWQAWAKTCAVPTFASGAVLRSALCLKLMVYQDTGAVIAGATTSVPQAMGTARTWDYRYCWLRDSTFVIEALRRLARLDEAERIIAFLRDVADCGPLQPLYGIGAERDVPEVFLDHLAGFAGNGRVRVGNAAAVQSQNDLFGELMLCLTTLLTDPRTTIDDPETLWPLIARLVDAAIVAAPKPDTGIWELRTMADAFTFSRAMCWAAIHHGSLLARRMGHSDHAERWSRIAKKETRTILERAWNADRGMLTQTLGGSHADAANLLLPSLGIIDARDPRFTATLYQYERILAIPGAPGLLRRYVHEDDFGHSTSAFIMCSFWLAEALALSGRVDDAIQVFERASAFANPLGLLSECVEPGSGTHLGNFPLAYAHASQIHAAITIGKILEVRDGKVRG